MSPHARSSDNDPASGNGGAEGPPATTETDLCNVVSKAALEELLGNALEEPKVIGSNQNACFWLGTGVLGEKNLSVSMMRADDEYAYTRQSSQERGKVTDVSGVGDKAFYLYADKIIGQLFALKGNTTLLLTMAPVGEELDEEGLDILKKWLGII